jgi:hypothetical protein
MFDLPEIRSSNDFVRLYNWELWLDLLLQARGLVRVFETRTYGHFSH